MNDSTVYICSEGRPWKKHDNGDFVRVSVKDVPSVPSNNLLGFLKPLGKAVRKPYDSKNGF